MENPKIVEPTTEKKQPPKKNVLGILSVVFAGVSLVGCWVPLLNVISMIFGIAAIITGIISFIFVLMKKSSYLALPIIGVILSIISIAFSNSVNTAVSDALSDKDTSQKVTSSTTDSKDTSSSSTQNTDENKEYKVGDTIAVNNQELTVTNVQRNYKPKYGSAKDGQEYVKVTLKLENKSDQSIHIASSIDTFKIQDSNGTIEGDHVEGWSMDDYFNASEIVPNGSKTGSLLFEVPKDDKNLTFIYEPKAFSDQRVKVKL
ncbi:MAG: DUF4352 domain-containing protein [Clostridia bacterium]|nr:DUF4352 domain-containing protein [Clostridia bacterium]